MTNFINYMIEANLALVLCLGVYYLLLRRETNFRVQRRFLLVGIIISVALPFIHINGANGAAAFQEITPTIILPEIRIIAYGNDIASADTSSLTIPLMLIILYLTVTTFMAVRFIIRLVSLLVIISKNKSYRSGSLNIIEVNQNVPTFSFFNYVVIGNVNNWSEEERKQIVLHEAAHASNYHSIDILLLELLLITFWINPLLIVYRRIVQNIHEFQADEHTVAQHDVNAYCSLLAKAALLSANVQLANQFTKSLTLKRIAMMKSMKTKFSSWKMIFIAPFFVLLSIFIACQEQVMEDMTAVAQSSTMAVDIPPSVQVEINKLEREYPGSKIIALEINTEEAQATARKLEEQYGMPRSLQIITTFEDDKNRTGEKRHFLISRYDENAKRIADRSAEQGEIFTIVENSAQPKDGMDNFYLHIMRSMRYPAKARQEGTQGKVFVEFVVRKDGSIDNVHVIKGIGNGCDEEAIRVITESPAWNPGTQSGQPVDQRMVLPITFAFGNLNTE